MITDYSGVTFAVHEVEPAREVLPEWPAVDGLALLTHGPVEACSDSSEKVAKNVAYNPFVYAVHAAYAGHRPLVFSPDMVWLIIAQGIAQHIKLHAEELRPQLVYHPGRKKLTVRCADAAPGSPFTDWPTIVELFNQEIVRRVEKETLELLAPDFSTTGPTERTAFHINTLDAYRHYFDYIVTIICGIPEITLTGTVDDWEKIRERSARIDDLGLGWWREYIEPVCAQFVRASQNDIDLDHWRSIYKVGPGYGGDTITGWVTHLFPYLQDSSGAPTMKNPLMSDGQDRVGEVDAELLSMLSGGDDLTGFLDQRNVDVAEQPPPEGIESGFRMGLRLDQFPTGLSTAPITMLLPDGESRRVEVLGGFVGIRQTAVSGALQPRIGWAVRDEDAFEILLGELVERHRTYPGIDELPEGFSMSGFPGELYRLYHRTNGAEIFPRGSRCACRILPAEDVGNPYQMVDNDRYRRDHWMHFADLSDGTRLAFAHAGREGWSIIRFRSDETDPPGYCPVVAKSVGELLRLLLSAEEPDFPDYGDAIRREGDADGGATTPEKKRRIKEGQ